MTMIRKSMDTRLAEIEKRVLPDGCKGRVSTTVEKLKKSNGNRVTTTLGCAGLLDGVVEVGVNEYGYVSRESSRQKQGLDAIANAASRIVNACADCWLGKTGEERQQAKELLAGADSLTTRLEIAQAERATAEAQLEAERLKRSGQ